MKLHRAFRPLRWALAWNPGLIVAIVIAAAAPSAPPTWRRNASVCATWGRPSTASAGSHTYYLVGRMVCGANSDDMFYYAQMTAVFYPANVSLEDRGAETDPEVLRKMEMLRR
jgi:hypothetical protein